MWRFHLCNAVNPSSYFGGNYRPIKIFFTIFLSKGIWSTKCNMTLGQLKQRFMQYAASMCDIAIGCTQWKTHCKTSVGWTAHFTCAEKLRGVVLCSTHINSFRSVSTLIHYNIMLNAEFLQTEIMRFFFWTGKRPSPM